MSAQLPGPDRAAIQRTPRCFREDPGLHWVLLGPGRHLMRVAVSVRKGALSSSTLLKRLRSKSEKRCLHRLREVGRVIRTVQLLCCYPFDAPRRRRMIGATNKVAHPSLKEGWMFALEDLVRSTSRGSASTPTPRDRHPPCGVRPKDRHRLHPVARAGPGRGRIRRGRLKGHGRQGLLLRLELNERPAGRRSGALRGQWPPRKRPAPLLWRATGLAD
ncbi:Tn3 family transposase [Streptomyces sp. 1222.5]|uniref:Tn3 family transposase n=1 Tax=Streptomyces sp. 1222.5 TaxID=1881026 RepID=UPI003EC153A8